MHFNYVSFERILIILHEIYMTIVTHPTSIFIFFFFLEHIVKAFQIAPWLYFLFRNSLQYPQSKRYSKRVSKRLSRVVAFIIDLSVSRIRVARKALSLRSCIAQFHPKHNAFKGVSKQLCVYHLYRNVFLAQTRIRSPFSPRFEKGVSNPLINTALPL